MSVCGFPFARHRASGVTMTPDPSLQGPGAKAAQPPELERYASKKDKQWLKSRFTALRKS
jgi:hypothetical protein